MNKIWAIRKNINEPTSVVAGSARIYAAGFRCEATEGSSKFLVQRKFSDKYDPAKYKRNLLYIESSGTQFIDTGISGLFKCGYSIDMMVTGVSNYYQHYLSANDEAAGIFPKLYRNVAHSPTGGTISIQSEDDTPCFVDVGERCVISFLNGSESVNGSVLRTIGSRPFGSLSVYIFSVSGGESWSCSSMRCYGVKLWSDSTLVRDMIPVMSMDDEPCLFDNVSGKIFRNSGTGMFTYGELEE